MSKVREYKSYAKLVNKETVYLVPEIRILKNGKKDYIKWNLGVTESGYEQTFVNFVDAMRAFNKVNKKIIEKIKEKNTMKIDDNSNDPLFSLWLETQG